MPPPVSGLVVVTLNADCFSRRGERGGDAIGLNGGWGWAEDWEEEEKEEVEWLVVRAGGASDLPCVRGKGGA